MEFFRLKDFKFSGKRVLVRVDFNVPLDKKGEIADDARIRAAIPTLKFILKQKPKQIVIMSHLGRPKSGDEEELKMGNVAKRVSELLKIDVVNVDGCIDVVLPYAKVVMLENLRFHNEEEANDREFSRKLASYAELYVNDAFGTMHRQHASVYGVAEFLPGCAGFLVEKELDAIKKLEKPQKPFIAVLGGAKVSDKIMVIENLLKKVDKLLIAGAMMFTFLKAKGYDVGNSLYEKDKVELARKLLKNKKIVLPVDVVIADEFDAGAKSRTVDADKIPAKAYGMDIGKKTTALFGKELKNAKTIVWNGPLGVFEFSRFAKGTNDIAKIVAKSKAVTVIGGGDSASAIQKLRLERKITHLSTGGGAFLEFLEGKKLPGISALEKNYKKYRTLIK